MVLLMYFLHAILVLCYFYLLFLSFHSQCYSSNFLGAHLLPGVTSSSGAGCGLLGYVLLLWLYCKSGPQGVETNICLAILLRKTVRIHMYSGAFTYRQA